MNRLLVKSSTLFDAAPELDKECRNHMKVWRLKDGEEVELFDGNGAKRTFKFCAKTGELRGCGEVSLISQPLRDLMLFACITKGSRWDWTLEKATELGVTHIYPVISERTIVRLSPDEYAAKVSRWERIIQDAARQSGAVWLPHIEMPMKLMETLDLLKKAHCFVGALTDKQPVKPLLTAATQAVREGKDAQKPLALFVGPEGDFTPDELAALLANGTPVSLGPTILRAETAAIYGLSVLAALNYTLDSAPSEV